MISPTVQAAMSLVESVCKITALLLGGAWAYYHYFRGRTYRSRLELSVSGQMFAHRDAEFVVATVSMKNVGLSKVPLEQSGTGLRVSTCEVPRQFFEITEWTVGRVFETFVHHGWVEPGESITERIFTKVPSGQLAVRLELRVVSGDQEWNTEEIIHPSFKKDRKPELAGQLEAADVSHRELSNPVDHALRR